MKQKLLMIIILFFQWCNADDNIKFQSPFSDNSLRTSLSVYTNSAPLPGGSFYSQALYVAPIREFLFIAGQLPIDPATNDVIMDPAEATNQCMLNIQALLTNAGMDFSNVKKVIIAITDMDPDNVLTICGVYASYLIPPFPTLSVIGVTELPLGSVVGIEAIAVA